MLKEDKKSKKGFEEYEISSAIETLQKAEEIKKDPELMKAIKKPLKRKINSLAELRKLAHEMKDEEDEYEDEE